MLLVGVVAGRGERRHGCVRRPPLGCIPLVGAWRFHPSRHFKNNSGVPRTQRRLLSINESPHLLLHRGLRSRMPLHPPTYTLHPTSFTVHPTLCSLHRSPFTLHPTPCTLHPAPYTLHLTRYTLHPTPSILLLHPTPYTLQPTPYTLHPAR